MRAYEDYEHHTLKLTAATQLGLGHFVWRALSHQALQRRVGAIEAAGLGIYRHHTRYGQKIKAMNVMSAQRYLNDYYTELASRRGNHARCISGKQEVKFAEAHQRLAPWVFSGL